jgi:anti-sigma regulatory factor (Ser/Thr protein kinase)
MISEVRKAGVMSQAPPGRSLNNVLDPLELPPSTDSVPRARRYVRQALGDSDGLTDIDTATLLVSELVTNAILHARTAVVVTVRSHAGDVRIEVHDRSGHSPRQHAFSASSATGRGLRLIESLAKRWGVEPDRDGAGKTVWCEVGPPGEASWEARAAADQWTPQTGR